MKVCLVIVGVILVIAAVVSMSVHPFGAVIFGVPALFIAIFGRLFIQVGKD